MHVEIYVELLIFLFLSIDANHTLQYVDSFIVVLLIAGFPWMYDVSCISASDCRFPIYASRTIHLLIVVFLLICTRMYYMRTP